MDASALSPLPTPARSDSHVPQVPQVPPRCGFKGVQTAPRSRTAAPVSTRNPSSTPSSPVPFTLPEFQFEAKHGRYRARAAADPLARVGGSRAPRSIFADNDDDLSSVLEESSMLGSVVRAAQRAGDDGPWPTATVSPRTRPAAAAIPVFRPAASPPLRPVDRGVLGSSPLARGNALAPPRRRDDELSAMSADTAYGSLPVTPNGGLDARAGRNAVPLILEPESQPEPATLYHPLADDANADFASRAISLALPPSSTLGRSYSGRTGVISLALPASSTLGRPAAPPPPLPRAAAATDLSRATSRSTLPTTVIDSTLPRTVFDGTTRPPTMATTQATSTLPRTLLDSTLPRSSVLGAPPPLPARYLEEVEMRPPPAAIPGMPGSMRLDGYDAQDSALGVDDVPVPARNWNNTAPGSPRPAVASRPPAGGSRVIVPPPRTAAVPIPIAPPPRAVLPSRPGEYNAAARRPVGSPRVPVLGSPRMPAPAAGHNVIPRDGPLPAVLRSAVPIIHATPRVTSPPPRAASANAPHAFRRVLIMAAGATVVTAIVVVVLVLFVH
ncbi:hypothetical protein GGF31_004037 [Allomyces arbusculus]|nr:hypothetical protein GGF31_004037 [Allomyces arbusculus]